MVFNKYYFLKFLDKLNMYNYLKNSITKAYFINFKILYLKKLLDLLFYLYQY